VYQIYIRQRDRSNPIFMHRKNKALAGNKTTTAKR
jgi:hypothetical protein